MKYREVVKRMKRKGYSCHEIKRGNKGSHRSWYNPETEKYSMLPYHGNKDIDKGLLCSFIKALGIDWSEFNS